MNICDLIDHAAGPVRRCPPGSPALHFEDQETWSYETLVHRTRRWAAGLVALGVGPGDRVALLLRNRLDYWTAYFAVGRVGAVAVRLNFRLVADELEYALADSGSTVLVAERDLVDRVATCLSRTAVGHHVVVDEDRLEPAGIAWSEHVAGAAPLTGDAPTTADDVAMIMYTSGTTGRPKGAMWTHGTTLSFSMTQACEWGIDASTVGLVTGPMYHVGALETLCEPALMMGGQAVVMASGEFRLERALALAERHGATHGIFFPFMLYELLKDESVRPDQLAAMRKIFTGGDPLLPWAVEAWDRRFPWIDLYQNYGLTEGSPVATCVRTRPGDPGGAVGGPMPLTEVSIRDDGGAELEPGELGEVWTRGPGVSVGYWNKPEATAATFVDGWCRTGDLGRATDDGQLVISGRKKDMIKTGGENVYAAEVEGVLARHPLVHEVAVIGVPDERYTEAVAAVVVLEVGASLTLEELQSWCREHLASYKKPRELRFVDALPRTPSGKVMKYQLQDAWASL